MEFRVGGLLFTSKFDSGNLARVERISKDEDEDSGGNYYTGSEPKPDYEFNCWTKPDCAGTEYENGNRSWFYFGIRGWTPGRLIKINIMNMNRQGKLYSQGHCPLTRTVPGRLKWERIRDRPTYETVDGQFILSFTYRFLEFKGATSYFAFSFPWSYQETQDQLAELDKKFAHCRNLTPKSPADSIYYHREPLTYSLDKLQIDLVTITACNGMGDPEPRFDKNLFPDKHTPRCKSFKNKRVFLLSSRVHPGETVGSFVFNGFLDLILRESDPRARQLRKQYVFKLIPLLNPDGVQRGHYRTDPKGVNLNRMYLDPGIDLHPSIYASKSVLVYHHVNNRVIKEGDNLNIQVNFPRNPHSSPIPTPRQSHISSRSSHSHSHRAEEERKTAAEIVNGASKRETTPPGVGVGLSDSVPIKSLDIYSLPQEGMSWRRQSDDENDNTVYLPSRIKVEPLNLADLEGTDTSLSDTYIPMDNGQHDVLLSSSCSSIISNLDKPERQVDSELRLRLSDMNLSEDFKGNIVGLSLSVVDSVDMDDPNDPNTENLGNEGSEDEGDFDITNTNCPHLSDPRLRDIPPHDSGIAFYVDLHGHASKRGCFIYGNYYENEDIQVENMLFPRLIALNTAHFDFTGCNFTERNMYAKDKRDGMSKEGSGRVAIHKALGIIHSYTLECNYNTGRMVNPVPPAHGDDGRATPPPLAGFPPKYTQAHFEEVGKALAIAAIDMSDTNPWSRLTLSEHSSLYGVRENVRRYLRSLRGGPRLPRNPSKPFLRNNGGNTSNLNNNRQNRATNSDTSFQGPSRFGRGTLESQANSRPSRGGVSDQVNSRGKPGGYGDTSSQTNYRQRGGNTSDSSSQSNTRFNRGNMGDNSQANSRFSRGNAGETNNRLSRGNNSDSSSQVNSRYSRGNSGDTTAQTNGRLTRGSDSQYGNGRPSVNRLNSTESTASGNSAASRGIRRESVQNMIKRELGPVKEARTNPGQSRPKRVTLPACASIGSKSAPNITNQAGPVTLTMTTAVVDSKNSPNPKSTDSSTRDMEEEKVEQLKHVNLLAISRKPGPPSRIPLPTSHPYVHMSGSPPPELSPPRVLSSRTAARQQRTNQKSSMDWEFMEPPTDKSPASGDIPVANATPLPCPPPVAPSTAPQPDTNGVDGLSSESPSKRRRKAYMKRRGMTASPKVGFMANKGQAKQSSATDTAGSDAERSKPRRRRRKSMRKNLNAGSPSSDEAGQDTPPLPSTQSPRAPCDTLPVQPGISTESQIPQVW